MPIKNELKIMLVLYILCSTLVSAEYYTCSSAGNACKVGTTCCKRSDGKYGCCPLENGICCKDGEGHCCPYGFPVCDIPHKRCTDHLSQYLGSPIKIEPLDIQESYNFIHGLGSGFGIALDQHTLCAENLSILITLALKTLNYIDTDGRYNENIYEMLEEGLKHLNRCRLDCMGIFEDGLIIFMDLFEDNEDITNVLWEVYERIGSIVRKFDVLMEYKKILQGSWHEIGFKIGDIVKELFRFS